MLAETHGYSAASYSLTVQASAARPFGSSGVTQYSASLRFLQPNACLQELSTGGIIQAAHPDLVAEQPSDVRWHILQGLTGSSQHHLLPSRVRLYSCDLAVNQNAAAVPASSAGVQADTC